MLQLIGYYSHLILGCEIQLAVYKHFEDDRHFAEELYIALATAKQKFGNLLLMKLKTTEALKFLRLKAKRL